MDRGVSVAEWLSAGPSGIGFPGVEVSVLFFTSTYRLWFPPNDLFLPGVLSGLKQPECESVL